MLIFNMHVHTVHEYPQQHIVDMQGQHMYILVGMPSDVYSLTTIKIGMFAGQMFLSCQCAFAMSVTVHQKVQGSGFPPILVVK